MNTTLEYNDFIKEVKQKSRKHKAFNSYGVYDYYKYYRKNKPKSKEYILTESQYFSIIRKINQHLGEDFTLGKDIVLPYGLGSIELRKFYNSVTIDSEGKVTNNMPIDWKSTLDLWSTDIECFNKKQLIKFNNKVTFKVLYNKRKVKYNNKSFYKFSLNKLLRTKLKNNITQNKIDAFTFN